MSNGEDADTPDDAGDGGEESPDPVPVADFEERLDAVAESLDATETEADLDDVEATLTAIEDDLDAATLEEADDDAEPREDLESRLDDLTDDLEDQRGPYLEDVTDVLSTAGGTISSSEWTEEGEASVADAVDAFFETASDSLDESFERSATAGGEIATELETATEELGKTGLDPDDDAAAIETLLKAADALTDALDDAQVFGDLEIREQLSRRGFYDVLTPENRQDFPPEWNAIKLYEAEGEVEPILTALDQLDSDFMESNVLDALEHIAPEAAFEDVHALAQRRNKQPVRILGRIGDERAADTLEDFLGGGDIALEKASLQALGAIGSEQSTEPVAQRLAADVDEVRAAAARALGMIGDTRAIEPLTDVLETDDAETVRASSAWALNQIGTARALEAVAAYEDDRSYLVQVEAEKATGV
jgi:HEAT repeat protein